MKSLFRGYYRPTPGELDEFWHSALIVLDTNVLLNLYRYTKETQDRFLEILRKFKSRLWLPNHAAKEFHRNRLTVISDQLHAYSKISEILDQHKKQIENELSVYRRHPIIKTTEIQGPFEKLTSEVKEKLLGQRNKHPDLFAADPILESVTSLFEGHVGDQTNEEGLQAIYKLGEQRYANAIPPGYSDAKIKQGDEKFGDLVIWQQILDYACSSKKPILFITDDAKDDWWWRFQGRTIGPRPELIEEMHRRANVPFYMYRTDQFMEYAGQYLEEHVSEEAINEVRELRKNDALSRRLSAHVHEQEKILAQHFNDLLRDREAIRSRQRELRDAFEHITVREDYLRSRLNERPDYAESISEERASLTKQRLQLEIDDISMFEQHERISTELKSLTEKLKRLERHRTRPLEMENHDISMLDSVLAQNLFDGAIGDREKK